MNPEQLQPPNQEALRHEAIQNTYRAALAHEDLSHMQILPGAKMELDTIQSVVDARTSKRGVGAQKLLAFVRSGDAMYSITSFEPENRPGEQNFVLNEIGTPDKPDQRAEVVNVFSEGLPLEVGSIAQEGLLRLEENGTIAVEATGQSNVELLYPKEQNEAHVPEEPAPEQVAQGGLRRFIDKLAVSREDVSRVEPLDLGAFHLWAPKTQEVAEVASRTSQEKARLTNGFYMEDDYKQGQPEQPDRDNIPPQAGIIDRVPGQEEQQESVGEGVHAKEEQLLDELNTLAGQFSEQDQKMLRMYAFNKANVVDDDPVSADHSRRAADALSRMTDGANAVAQRYADVFLRLQK